MFEPFWDQNPRFFGKISLSWFVRQDFRKQIGSIVLWPNHSGFLFGILPFMPLVPGYPCSVPGYPLIFPGYPGSIPACLESVLGCPWFILSHVLSAMYQQLQQTKWHTDNDLIHISEKYLIQENFMFLWLWIMSEKLPIKIKKKTLKWKNAC